MSDSASSGVPYATRSLSLASYLSANGHRVEVSTLIGSGGCVYRFPATPELLALVNTYESGEALIEPVAFETAKAGIRKQQDQLRKSR